MFTGFCELEMGYVPSVPEFPDLLKHGEKQIAPLPRAKQRLPLVTTTGDEVQVSGTVVAFEPPRHSKKISDERDRRSERRHTGKVMNPKWVGRKDPCLENRETWGTRCQTLQGLADSITLGTEATQ
jgi:hypothetical protein